MIKKRKAEVRMRGKIDERKTVKDGGGRIKERREEEIKREK